MKLINIGFGNMVSANRLIAIVSPESAPIKRIIQDSRDRGTLIDATYGRRTRAVLITDSDHVILSAVQPETVANRVVDYEDEEEMEGQALIGSYTAPKEHGILVVFSGPSGAGKGTILKRYFEDDPPAVLSVSATTRAPRPGEVDGVHYHFISRAEFEQLIANDGVLEYNIYNGNYYGSPRGPIEEELSKGHDVILENRNQRRRPYPPHVPQRPFHLCGAALL